MARIDRALPRIRRAPALAADMADLVHGLKSLFDPYRPELHYMRGPGPAWHAKHDRDDVMPGEEFAPALARAEG